MKRSLIAGLIENSKIAQRVTDEIGKVPYDNIKTPTNHEKGKTRREVKVKNLGELPGKGKKKAPQVKPPQARERRSMQEDHDWPIDKEASMTNSKANQKNRDEGMKKPKVIKTKPVKAVKIDSGSTGDRNIPFDASAATKTRKLPDSYRGGERVSVETVHEQEVRDKRAGILTAGNSDNSDEGQATPNFVKRDPATGGKIAKDQNTGKALVSPTGNPDLMSQDAAAISVAKLKEELAELSRMVGKLDINIGGILENYPDGMDHSVLDGDEDEEAEKTDADDSAIEAMKPYLAMEVPVFVRDMRSLEHAEDRAGMIEDFIDGVYGIAAKVYNIHLGANDKEYNFEVDGDVVGEEIMNAVGQLINPKDMKRGLADYFGHSVAEDLLLNPHTDGAETDEDDDEIDEMSSGGAVGSGAIASTPGAGGKRSQLFADESDMTVEEFLGKLDPYMSSKYLMSWSEMSGKREPIIAAIERNMSPEEFGDRWAKEHDYEAVQTMGG